MSQSFDQAAEMIRKMAQLLDETDLNEIEYEAEHARVRVVRHRPEVTMAPNHFQPAVATEVPPCAPTKDLVENISSHPGAVKSPMVGNAYVSGEPGAPAFVKEGDTVTAGQVILIIEAMKVMNPIKSPKSGVISKVLVIDAQPVEFEEVLFIID